MSVSITIRTATAAYEAFRYVATVKQKKRLVNFIIWSGDVVNTLELLDHLGENQMLQLHLNNRQFKQVAQTMCTRATLSQVMDCLSNLPADEKIARHRGRLIDRLMKGPIKVWLKGERAEHNVHSAFRRAKFLPAEVELMRGKIKRSRNREYTSELAKFSACNTA